MVLLCALFRSMGLTNAALKEEYCFKGETSRNYSAYIVRDLDMEGRTDHSRHAAGGNLRTLLASLAEGRIEEILEDCPTDRRSCARRIAFAAVSG